MNNVRLYQPLVISTMTDLTHLDCVIFSFNWRDTALHLNIEVPKLSVHNSHSVYFLTYDLSVRAEYGCVLSDRGARRHQTDSLSGCLGFDLRHNDVGSREILGLTSTLSCV